VDHTVKKKKQREGVVGVVSFVLLLYNTLNIFTVKTSIGQSPIHGSWVFAQENIKKWQIIWEYNTIIDKTLRKEELLLLSEIERSYVYYAKDEWWYILCWDAAKFTNHSDDPNTQKLNPTQTIAIKDIGKGIEITEDYYYFDGLAENKLKFPKNP